MKIRKVAFIIVSKAQKVDQCTSNSDCWPNIQVCYEGFCEFISDCIVTGCSLEEYCGLDGGCYPLESPNGERNEPPSKTNPSQTILFYDIPSASPAQRVEPSRNIQTSVGAVQTLTVIQPDFPESSSQKNAPPGGLQLVFISAIVAIIMGIILFSLKLAYFTRKKSKLVGYSLGKAKRINDLPNSELEVYLGITKDSLRKGAELEGKDFSAPREPFMAEVEEIIPQLENPMFHPAKPIRIAEYSTYPVVVNGEHAKGPYLYNRDINSKYENIVSISPLENEFEQELTPQDSSSNCHIQRLPHPYTEIDTRMHEGHPINPEAIDFHGMAFLPHEYTVNRQQKPSEDQQGAL
jgi:hypothetical protein